MRNRSNPNPEATMPRKTGAKSIPKDVCKTIYAMSVVGVRNKDIAYHYSMTAPTVLNIIYGFKKRNKTTKMKNMERKHKLTDRGMRVLQRYILANCFEPLYVTTCRFNEGTRLQLSIPTVRRYIKKMNMARNCSCPRKTLRKVFDGEGCRKTEH